MNYDKPRRYSSRSGVTIPELLIVIAIVSVIVMMILPATPLNDYRARAGCQSNLKEMGTIFRMYSDEAPGNRYPTRALYSLSPDGALLYPDYISNFEIWACPSSREAEALLWSYSANPWYNDAGEVRMAAVQLLGDMAYTYFGFHVSENAWTDPPSPVELPMIKALRNPNLDEARIDYPAENPERTIWARRLHPGVAKEMADAGAFEGDSSDLPVMWDGLSSRTIPGPPYDDELFLTTWSNHFEIGANVLFLDGHVEYREYGRDFPHGEEIARLELYGMVHWQARGPGGLEAEEEDKEEH